MKWWQWLLAGLAVGAGAFMVVWYTMQGRRADALKASVDMMVGWHQKDVAAKKARIEELRKDFAANEGRIAALNKQLAEKKAKLKKSYTDSGLTADEISERFNRIAL